MFERFTDGSRRAVVLAQQAAVDLRHHRIAVVHLLLGIARAEQGTGAVALADQGVTPDRLVQAVRQVVPPNSAAPAGGDGHIPFTPAAKQSIEFSLEEATQRGVSAIDTGHLLLALLRQSGDELPAVLAAAGLDEAALGLAVERRLADGARASPDPPSRNRGQLDRIEAQLSEALARLARIEARLDHPEAS